MAAILRRGSRPRGGQYSEAELAAQPATAAAEGAEKVARVEAELLQDAGVLLRVDLVGQLAVRLRRLVLLAARAQQLEDLLLGDLHVASVRLWKRGLPGARGRANAAASHPVRALPAVAAAARVVAAAPRAAAPRGARRRPWGRTRPPGPPGGGRRPGRLAPPPPPGGR